ncbi:MAG: transcriptional regulator [Leptothrix sp. (in: Bacteria)]|nr:transcriptional regulator [Leptothrix sp. (in: b-proteobacteria)]
MARPSTQSGSAAAGGAQGDGARVPLFGVAAGLDPDGVERLGKLAAERRVVARGALLFRQGDPLGALYEVHAGFFKSCVSDEQGRSQVTGFHLSGELLGLDALGSGQHGADAQALEDSVVCVMPFEPLNELLRDFASLQHEFHRLMSREITRDQSMMLVLGTLNAEGRIAAFLLDLTQRLQARGFSATALVLRMTREEIGSYLGLQLETVSRTFSKLQRDGVLEIRRNRELELRHPEALQRLVQGTGR